jgi:Tfp pilus assembly protein PilV
MSKRRRKSGFNIAEVLIACVLICTIAVSLFGVWAWHARATAQSRDFIIASSFAQQWMEGAMSAGYTASNISSTPILVNETVAGTQITHLYNYAVNTSLQYTNDGNSALRLVTVYVWWDDQVGTHTLNVTSRLSWEG